MSRSEKRFFKIHLRTHSSKHSEAYESLFDKIALQEEYQEDVLIKEFKKAGQRFPVLKHRLFEKVVDALEVFSRSNDPALALRTELNRAQVLLSRGLFSQGCSILDSVTAKAEDLGMPDLVIHASRLLIAYLGPDLENQQVPDYDLKEWDTKMNSLLEQVKDEWSFAHQRALVFKQLETGIRDVQKDSVATLQLNSSDLSDKSATCRFLWHHSMAADAFIHNNAKDTLHHTNASLEILQEHTYLTKDHKLSLAKMFANGFYSAYRSHDLDQAEVYMVRLKVMFKEERDSPEFPEYLALYLQCKLFIENHMHSYHDAEHVQDMEVQFLKYRPSLNTYVRAGLDYGFALFHHGTDDNTAALKALNRILNASDITRDDEVYARSLIFANVLYIEADDREWLMHSARTLKRYLNSRERMGETEAALLRYIADIRRSRTIEGEARALARYTETLRSIRRTPQERISFEYFDFLLWAENRGSINKRTYGLVA
jgi:hypothetical protein